MKKIVVIIVNFLCLTLLSLSDTQYKMKGNTVRDESYNFEIATYTDYKENDIYIEFPQINGLQNRNNERKINESIKNTVLKDLVYNSKKLYPELQLITTMKCQVTLHTDDKRRIYKKYKECKKSNNNTYDGRGCNSNK